jgi:hypothetical protein
MNKKLDLTNHKYGRLTVLAPVENTSSGKTQWLCRCDCGKTATVVSARLRSGITRSCGCLSRENSAAIGKSNAQHGFASHVNPSRTYRIWMGMKTRCTNPNSDQWQNYGGRGVKVCDRWLHSFECFLEDMGEPPSTRHSIERIDVDGNYEPDNCTWIPLEDQQYNRRNSLRLEFQGKTQALALWAKELGLDVHLLQNRLKLGWTVERAFTTPVDRRFGHLSLHTFQGKTQSLSAWSRELKINRATLEKRLRSGWSIEKAFSTPVKS